MRVCVLKTIFTKIITVQIFSFVLFFLPSSLIKVYVTNEAFEASHFTKKKEKKKKGVLKRFMQPEF